MSRKTNTETRKHRNTETRHMPLYLGLDCSTQSLTAIVIEINGDTRRVVFSRSLNFDRDLPEYETTGGVRRGIDDNEVFASPLMWADALDRMPRGEENGKVRQRIFTSRARSILATSSGGSPLPAAAIKVTTPISASWPSPRRDSNS